MMQIGNAIAAIMAAIVSVLSQFISMDKECANTEFGLMQKLGFRGNGRAAYFLRKASLATRAHVEILRADRCSFRTHLWTEGALGNSGLHRPLGIPPAQGKNRPLGLDFKCLARI